VTAGGRRPGRPPIPRDRILQTALDIVDEDGADALTLRALADRLGSSTSTLYRHVSGRVELTSLVVDRLLGEAAVDERRTEALAWDDACRHIATTVYETLARHSNAAPLLVDVVPTGPHGMAMRESLLAALLRAGFAPDRAALTTATLAHYVLGFAVQIPGAATPGTTTDDDGLLGADPQEFPHIASVAHHLPRPLGEEFAHGLDLILAGLRGEVG
jgi:AcrR family transcriptional regulator